MRYYRPVISYGESNALDSQVLALAADTVVSVKAPSTARQAKIKVGGAVHYTLDGTDPSNSRGFPLASGTHTITVGDRSTLKIFETGGATTGYIQFFGGDRSVRLRGGHDSINVTTGAVSPLIDEDANSGTFPNAAERGLATELLVRGTTAWAYTVDGTTPTADVGIQVAGNTTVVIPCRRATKVQVIARGAAAVLQVQAFEDHDSTNNAAPLKTSAGVTGHVYNALNANVLTVLVPKNANFARVSSVAQAVYYTVNGVNPTSANSFRVAAGATEIVTVSPGRTLKFLRAANGAKLNVAIFGY